MGVRLEVFDLSDKIVVITGGLGLLGRQHAKAVVEAGGRPLVIDKEVDSRVVSYKCDISHERDVYRVFHKILADFGRADVLINNAANNPVAGQDDKLSRLENFSVEQWDGDVAVGLTGAFLCSKVFGSHMASRGSGVILNIASDLAIIAPNQGLYRKDGVAEEDQPVKPVSYSVVKAGLIGLTRYLATYWACCGVRVNALCPGGVYDNQDDVFVERLTQHIPMGRMAEADEYRGAVQFLCSDASKYMTGQSLIVDGGRCCW